MGVVHAGNARALDGCAGLQKNRAMIRLAATAFLLLVCAMRVATGEDGPAPIPDPEIQAARLAELTAAVERDRERLKQLVSQERAAEPSLEESPELREIAARLPALQAELRELRQLRQRVGTTSP